VSEISLFSLFSLHEMNLKIALTCARENVCMGADLLHRPGAAETENVGAVAWERRSSKMARARYRREFRLTHEMGPDLRTF
jgi:hypothetical protein